MTETLKWMPDKKIENELVRLGIKWDAVDVPLSSIDQIRSSMNPGRDEVLMPDEVERYVLAMTRGAVFPYGVACRSPKGRFINLGGKHRERAAEKYGSNSMMFYVLRGDLDDQQQAVLTTALNSIEGVANTKAHRIRQGLYLIKEFGWTAKKAADALLLPVCAIENAYKEDAVAIRLTEHGVSVKGFTPTHLRELSKIKLDRVLDSAAKLVSEAGLTADQTSEIAKNACLHRDELKQLEVVSTFKKQYIGNGLPEPKPTGEYSRFRKLKTCLTGIENIIDVKSPGGLQVPANDRAEIAKRFITLATKMSQLAKKLKAMK